MRVGDKVRDRAHLGGIVQKIVPGTVCRVLVEWSNGFTCWINAKWLRPEKTLEELQQDISNDIRELLEPRQN